MTQLGTQPPPLPPMIPRSSTSLELDGDVRDGRLVIVALPSCRQIVTLTGDPSTLLLRAAERLDELQGQLRAFRRYMERPDGTCPRCAGPVDAADELAKRHGLHERWCPLCKRDVLPAGVRA